MLSATAGSGAVSLANATLAGSASCTFSINVTGTTAGIKNNTTSAVTSVEGGTGGTASSSITVIAVGPSPTSIPTLQRWALWLLGLLVVIGAGTAMVSQRKKS